MRISSTFLSLALGLSLASAAAVFAASGTDVSAIAQAVDARYNHMQTLEAHFTEIYRGAGMERTESGTLWLKKPGKMCWQYTVPIDKLYVSDGKNAWFYVPADMQVRKTPLRKLADLQSPLAFLLGKTKLEKELTGLSLASDVTPLDPKDVVLRGVPKALADQTNEVMLEITPQSLIARILVEQIDGSETEFRFSQQKENVQVSEQRFQFTPPPGVEVISGEPGQ
jgi:outer membrane lipoprotein carrier protein